MNWDEQNFLKCKQDVEDWEIGNNLYQCPFCQKQSTKIGIILHVKIHFGYNHKIKGHEAWNKGLTAETDDRVKKYVTTLKEKQSNKTEKSKYKKLSPEKEKARRLKLSEAMKKAHKEKRAWNIGKSRWNNEKSYPEKFLERVLKNHVIDLNYITEYPFYIYSLDFAWPHLKKCIEIDGEQHFRFEEYKQRDICKNELLLQNGWIVLRIRYKYFYNNTKEYIEKIIYFIDFNNNDFLLDTYYQNIQQ
jgi:very-short-patch-repair endonuclease